MVARSGIVVDAVDLKVIGEEGEKSDVVSNLKPLGIHVKARGSTKQTGKKRETRNKNVMSPVLETNTSIEKDLMVHVSTPKTTGTQSEAAGNKPKT